MKSIIFNNTFKAIVLCAVSLFYINCGYSNPSQADISPLYNITSYPMYGLEELKGRFEKLKDKEGVSNFDGFGWRGLDDGGIWTYHYFTPIVNTVYLRIFDNSDYAKNYFEIWQKNSHEGLENRIEKISEDIDVILWHSKMYRDEYGFYTGTALYTCIRIGNIVINLSEHYKKSKTKKNGIPTTKNIEMICQVLTE